MKTKNIISWLLFAITVWSESLSVHAVQVRLNDHQVSIQAENESLRSILDAFTTLGIDVRLDPTIKTNLTLDIRSADLEQTIAQITKPYGYALIWNEVKGPFGVSTHLEQVRVFRVGQEKAAVMLKTNTVLQVQQGWNGTEYVADELLISFKPGTSMESFKLLLAQLGATIVDGSSRLGYYRLRFPPGTNIEALMAQLKNTDYVHTVEPNYVYRLPSETRMLMSDVLPTKTITKPAKEGAAALAILDSGIRSMDEFGSTIVGTYDALNPDDAINDLVGHGTQMALVASGAVVPAGGDADQAQQAVPVVAVKAFDENGCTSNFDLMRGLEYAIDQGSRVINLSWGSETKSVFLENAMNYAQANGAIVVASAGNEPINKPIYPAACSGVLAVGAVDADGTLWDQSNYGEFVDLVAPGEAYFPVGYKGPPGSYAGTSVASVYVAKNIATYFSLHPEASPQEALHALASSLTEAGNTGKDDYYGLGVLDASAMKKLLE